MNGKDNMGVGEQSWPTLTAGTKAASLRFSCTNSNNSVLGRLYFSKMRIAGDFFSHVKSLRVVNSSAVDNLKRRWLCTVRAQQWPRAHRSLVHQLLVSESVCCCQMEENKYKNLRTSKLHYSLLQASLNLNSSSNPG